MSSTELDAPPIRSILLAIVTVVGLHLLTAFALVTIKTPTLKSEPETDTPPVEIQFVTLPAQSAEPKAEVLPQEVSVQKPAQPTVEPQPTTPPKAETSPRQRVETPIEPVVKQKVPDAVPVIATEQTSSDSRQKPLPKETSSKQAVPKKTNPEPIVDTSADERRKEAAAQAKKAAQDAEAKAAELKAAKAAQEAKRVANAKAAAQAKAARDAAEAAAQAKAEAEAAAAAQSNEPVSFTASAANWASAPNFSFPERAARRARSGDVFNVVLSLRVNKQGGIDSVSLAQSSGNPVVDREAQRQVRSGKFKPFTNNSGTPVVGNVTLPISYAVP